MKKPYVEKDCIFEFEGKQFKSGGAEVTENYVIGYMSEDMTKITTWHGELITDRVKVVSSWSMPRSWISSRQYQVRANIEGNWFTGRTMGGGMLVRLKRCK